MPIYLQGLLIAFLFLKISAEIHPLSKPGLYDENSSYQKEVLDEDDYTDESDTISDGQKKSYFLDDARLEKWQKRLRWISKWMDQMSANYARGQPKIFERYSRGRLDRMPLSYGKRSPGYEQFFLKDDGGEMLKTIRRRLDRVPVAYRKSGISLQDNKNVLQDFLVTITEPIDSVENKSEDESNNDPFVFVDDARDPQEQPQNNRELNRLPLSYGKRSWEDFFNTSPYNRISRSRLDRMPLLYGKRGDKSIYVDCLKEESNRPLEISVTSEKEGKVYIKCNPMKTLGNVPTPKENFSKHEDWTVDKSHKMALYLDDISPLIRLKRSLFERVPFSNGNDIYNPFQQPLSSSLDTPIHDTPEHPNGAAIENLELHERSRLERMPLTYGKRLISSIKLYNKRSRLNRMPLTYGKRGVVTPEESQSDSKEASGSKTVMKEFVNKERDKQAIIGNSSVKESNHYMNI